MPTHVRSDYMVFERNFVHSAGMHNLHNLIRVCHVCRLQYSLTKTEKRTYQGQEFVVCRESFPDSDALAFAYTLGLFIITFAAPMLCIVVIYCVIGWTLLRRRVPGNSYPVRQKAPIKMLVLLVLSFGLLWLPLHLFFLAWNFFPGLVQSSHNDHNKTISEPLADQLPSRPPLFIPCHILAMCSAFVNPVIYSWASKRFRVDFVHLWKLIKGEWGNSSSARQRHYSSSEAKPLALDSRFTLRSTVTKHGIKLRDDAAPASPPSEQHASNCSVSLNSRSSSQPETPAKVTFYKAGKGRKIAIKVTLCDGDNDLPT